jgi:hypothetical protein
LPLYDGDIDINCKVDFYDFVVLGDYWLDDSCSEPDWCEGADIDWSTSVDIEDLYTLAKDWLKGS